LHRANGGPKKKKQTLHYCNRAFYVGTDAVDAATVSFDYTKMSFWLFVVNSGHVVPRGAVELVQLLLVFLESI
jgi:hypothetical protein